jgi:hypothetical protein
MTLRPGTSEWALMAVVLSLIAARRRLSLWPLTQSRKLSFLKRRSSNLTAFRASDKTSIRNSPCRGCVSPNYPGFQINHNVPQDILVKRASLQDKTILSHHPYCGTRRCSGDVEPFFDPKTPREGAMYTSVLSPDVEGVKTRLKYIWMGNADNHP